jgi:alpha-galactosidase
MIVRVLTVIAALAVAAAALNNGAGLTPPLGWTTWCGDGPCGNDYCSESYVKTAAEAMLSNGMVSAGYRWVLLDDCWAAGSRTAQGTLTWDVSRFPSGIPSLVQWLHARGLSFGLYTSAGNTTCSSGGRPYPIPGSEHHYQLDADTFASWEVDYVKVDWCGDVKKMPLDGLFVGAKDYTDFSAALTSSTPRRTMYFEGVAAFIFLLWDVDQYVNAWRASTDHHDNWDNTLEVLATVEVVGKAGAPGGWSYMDVLMTGGQGCSSPNQRNSSAHCPGMSDDEYTTEFTLWSIYQSPLLVSTDIRNMTSIMRKLLLNKRVLEIHQDTRTPPGKHKDGDDGCGELGALTCQYFIRPLADGSVLLALFNGGIFPHAITFPFAKIGWSESQQVLVEDLWNGSNSSVTGSYVSPVVSSHGSNYVVLHKA